MYMGEVALLAIVQRAVTLIGEQVGKAQNGIQRRVQLVVLRGENLILELAAALNFLLSRKDGMRKLFNLSLGSFQFRCTFPDALLQLIMSLSQSSLALLDLRQHLIEGIDEDSQLGRAADRHGADRIVFVLRNNPCNFAQIHNGFSNSPAKDR